jgi:hypothetical protein
MNLPNILKHMKKNRRRTGTRRRTRIRRSGVEKK